MSHLIAAMQCLHAQEEIICPTFIVVVPSSLLKTYHLIPLPFMISKDFDPWQLSVSQRQLCMRCSYLIGTAAYPNTYTSSLPATFADMTRIATFSEVFLIHRSCTGSVPILQWETVPQSASSLLLRPELYHGCYQYGSALAHQGGRYVLPVGKFTFLFNLPLERHKHNQGSEAGSLLTKRFIT